MRFLKPCWRKLLPLVDQAQAKACASYGQLGFKNCIGLTSAFVFKSGVFV
jgi:hypothetical protein